MADNLLDLLLNRRVAWLLLVIVTLLAAAGVPLALQVTRDDDLLAFLPAKDPDVTAFREVSLRFGGLDVTIVGIDTPDAYDGAFLQRLRNTTTAIEDVEGVDFALSLTSVDDFRTAPTGGIVAALLVDTIPLDAEASRALRNRVEASPWILGNLVSRDGRGAVIYAFHGIGADTRAGATEIDRRAQAVFGDTAKSGGAPAISAWIYESTERDLSRLTPWALLLIVGIAVLSFRNVWGVVLPLATTSLGVLATRAAMGASGEPFTLVLAAMPVILFALGTAFSVHILARYYTVLADGLAPHAALRRAYKDVAPTVLFSGLSTAAGLGSCIAMNIRPMRMFGAFTSIGILTTLVLSLTLVPALIGLLQMRGTAPSSGRPTSFTSRFARLGRDHPLAVGLSWTGLVVLAVVSARTVDARVDLRSFLPAGSPPSLASDFLDRQFGGTQVAQIEVSGNLKDPAVLRHVAGLADRLSDVAGVSRVDSVTDVVARANEAFTDARRIPDTQAQMEALYGFLAGRRAVDALVTRAQDATLLHARISSDDPATLEAVVSAARALAGEAAGTFSARVDPVVARTAMIGRIAHLVGKPTDAVGQAFDETRVGADSGTVVAALAKFLGSEECFVPLVPEVAQAVAVVWVGAPVEQRNAATLVSVVASASPDDVVVAIDTVFEDIVAHANARAWADALVARLGTGDRAAVAGALRDEHAGYLVPDPGGDVAVQTRVTGTPAVYTALSRAVLHNLGASLQGSLWVCAILNLLLFRTVRETVLATVPTLFCVACTFGLMGALGVRLDVGTSMLGSIAVGAGVDFSMHVLWAMRGDPGSDIARGIRERAPGIWVNAWMVSGGFLVLTLGDAVPLRNVGSLTAIAILTSALATFSVIPWLSGLWTGSSPKSEST